MAKVEPFYGLRYAPEIPLEKVVTQPYDKISKEMQERYYSLHPQNIVRIVLGKVSSTDTDAENVYTRARNYLQEWQRTGVLTRLARPSFLAYFQRFTIPGTQETRLRKGFIGLGRLEDYAAKVVFPHERTLTGPKQDRLQLLRHTHTHFEQIFMLYEDPSQRIDGELDRVAEGKPDMQVKDEDGVEHTLWILDDSTTVDSIRHEMHEKKLIIADGHHRYETALAYRDECRAGGEATSAGNAHEWMPMTFFNMHSPGLTILPTHRVLSGLKNFDSEALLARSRELFEINDAPPEAEAFRRALTDTGKQRITIGACLDSARRQVLLLLKPSVAPDLDVIVLHRLLIEQCLGISEEAIKKESHLSYVRDFSSALSAVRDGTAQASFLLNPTRLDQMRDLAYAGKIMPQKSTDFYPKVLSGLVLYSLDD